MPTAAILLSQENKVFQDLAKALQLSFMELGWDAMWIGDEDQITEYARDIDVAIVLAPHDYPKIHRLLPRAIRVLWQLEQLPWPTRIHQKRRGHFGWWELQKLVPQYHHIFECDKGNIKEHWRYYKKQPIHHMPVGYSSVFELNKKTKKRNVAMFLGSDSTKFCQRHRAKTLKTLKHKLKDQFSLCTGRYGDRARQAVKRSAINLNIHQSLPLFESLRVVGLLMSNKCFVISEYCYDETLPFKRHEHWAVCDHHKMPSLIKYYLETPWERERMAMNAYNFIKKDYTMTQHLKKALEGLK